jgi:hypothetical protein
MWKHLKYNEALKKFVTWIEYGFSNPSYYIITTMPFPPSRIIIMAKLD